MRFDNRNETLTRRSVSRSTKRRRVAAQPRRYDTFNLVSCEKHFRQAIFAAAEGGGDGGGEGGQFERDFGREKLD